MEPILTDAHRRLLRMIFDRGAEGASLALSKWLGARGPPGDQRGRARRAGTGRRAARPARDPGRRLCHGADRPAHRLDPPGLRGPRRAGAGRPACCTSRSARPTAWGELEQSAARETTNIVGCAYVNALAAHLPGRRSPWRDELVPTPPTFLHEFAGSLLEFALMEQAMELDQVC